MLDSNEIESEDKILKERKNNLVAVIIGVIGVGLFAYLEIFSLAFLGIVVTLTSHTNIRYWDTKLMLIKYTSKGGKTK